MTNTIKAFDNEFVALSQKQVDIVIEEPLLTYQKTNAGGVDIKSIVETRVVFQTVPFQLMIGKKSPYLDILPIFNQKVREIRLDGTMEQIMSKYNRYKYFLRNVSVLSQANSAASLLYRSPPLLANAWPAFLYMYTS